MNNPTIVVSRRATPQPLPKFNAGGDCGPCVLSGLLGIPVADVYKLYGDGAQRYHEPHTEGKIQPLTFDNMVRAFIDAEYDGRLDRVGPMPPEWTHGVYQCKRHFGVLASEQCQEWWKYIQMALTAGYYGVTEVDYERKGPLGMGPNHWVMIVGMREIYPPAGQSGRILQEVLISCSAKGGSEYWIEMHDFLDQMGGFCALWARPKETV